MRKEVRERVKGGKGQKGHVHFYNVKFKRLIFFKIQGPFHIELNATNSTELTIVN